LAVVEQQVQEHLKLPHRVAQMALIQFLALSHPQAVAAAALGILILMELLEMAVQVVGAVN
jgi:hypothetical protein